MRAELAERSADPWRKKVEGAVRGEDAISTAALLDLIGLPNTTGNARRISRTMQSLGCCDQEPTIYAGWLARHLKPRLGASPPRTQKSAHRELNPG